MSRDQTWRTVDIVVAAALAVAFGVVFWAWNSVWEATKPIFTAATPAQYIISGVWLIPAVLGGLVILHAPGRFTVGALAAFRLMPLFADEWQTIALARRARGLETARAIAFFSMTRSLLVAAIRRATRLAVAMDGRGFADPGCHTLARPRAFAGRDWWLIAASLTVAILASVASIAAGTWRFFLAR